MGSHDEQDPDKFRPEVTGSWQERGPPAMTTEPERPDDGTPLLQYTWVVVRLSCHVCARHVDVRLAALAARYGHRIPIRTVLRAFMVCCSWDAVLRDA